MTKTLAIYTASKLHHAPMWQELAKAWPKFHWTARWVTQHTEQGKTIWPHDAAHGAVFWEHDLTDVMRSDVVLCYATRDDELHGALVECGMAIATGRKVIVVGEHKSYSTWQFHPSVLRVADFNQAISLLRLMGIQ